MGHFKRCADARVAVLAVLTQLAMLSSAPPSKWLKHASSPTDSVWKLERQVPGAASL